MVAQVLGDMALAVSIDLIPSEDSAESVRSLILAKMQAATV